MRRKREYAHIWRSQFHMAAAIVNNWKLLTRKCISKAIKKFWFSFDMTTEIAAVACAVCRVLVLLCRAIRGQYTAARIRAVPGRLWSEHGFAPPAKNTGFGINTSSGRAIESVAGSGRVRVRKMPAVQCAAAVVIAFISLAFIAVHNGKTMNACPPFVHYQFRSNECSTFWFGTAIGLAAGKRSLRPRGVSGRLTSNLTKLCNFQPIRSNVLSFFVQCVLFVCIGCVARKVEQMGTRALCIWLV